MKRTEHNLYDIEKDDPQNPYTPYNPGTQWKEIQQRAEKAVERICNYAGERAAVIFAHYGFTWKPSDEEFVPEAPQLAAAFKSEVHLVREYESGGGGSGRLRTTAEYDYEGKLIGIQLCVVVGTIPIEYLYENAHSYAETMARENTRR